MNDEEFFNGEEFRENDTNIKELIYINDYGEIPNARNNEVPKLEYQCHISHQNKIKNKVFSSYEAVNCTSLNYENSITNMNKKVIRFVVHKNNRFYKVVKSYPVLMDDVKKEQIKNNPTEIEDLVKTIDSANQIICKNPSTNFSSQKK